MTARLHNLIARLDDDDCARLEAYAMALRGQVPRGVRPRVWRVLCALRAAPGRILSHDALLMAASPDPGDPPECADISNTIFHARRKLQPGERIVCVYGQGYVLQKDTQQ